MAIINNVEIHWVKCDPARPERYQGKGPAKFSVQIRVKDKKTKESLEKDYGFKFSPMEDKDGKLVYKTSISRYAFGSDKEGNEDTTKPNKPVNVILADGTALDPNTVGNGSIANVSFFTKEDKSGRTLKGIQVKKLVKFEARTDEDEFELSDDFEIVEAQGKENENDPY
jgi:hypothetical protein